MKILYKLAQWSAVLGGLLMTVITLITCVSLIGRNTMGWTLAGDFELTGVVSGAAVALFLPWCQARKGNIIVDFFTNGANPSTQQRLDRLGALLLAAAMGLMTWYSTIGGINAYRSGSGSQILGFPDWLVFAFIVPGLALTALIALAQSLHGHSEDQAQ